MKSFNFLKAIAICVSLLVTPVIFVGQTQAGAQLSHGVVSFKIDGNISKIRKALRKAEKALKATLKKSKSLVRKANRTRDLNKKLKYLQQSVDILTQASQLKSQADALKKQLSNLNAIRKYEKQLATEKRREKEILKQQETIKAEQKRLAEIELEEENLAKIKKIELIELLEIETAKSTPMLVTEGTSLEAVVQNVVVAEVADILTSKLLAAMWNRGTLKVWGDQLNGIAVEGMVKSRLAELSDGATGIASLGQSVAIDLAKDTIIDVLEEYTLSKGMSPLAAEPMKYVLNTTADAAIFTYLHPKIASQAPLFVAITSATTNAIEVMIEATIVGVDAKIQHNRLVATREQLDQKANDLTDFGYELKSKGETEAANFIFKMATEAGNAAREFRDIYPYESLLDAAWPVP